MKNFKDNSIASIVTDPPYGLSFMNKKWDYDVPSVDIWKEALRVLKPGGHLLSFGGTRTYHRMVVNIEDAGFEIRDCIQWLYGSGFPKSHNIGEGWGSALKPANEPIVVARKPLEKGLTIAANVLKYGTGAINIDASRISLSENDPNIRINETKGRGYQSEYVGGKVQTIDIGNHGPPAQGRWPANIIFDEEAAQVLDAQSGAGPSSLRINPSKQGNSKFHNNEGAGPRGFADSGGASRFFYVAKASKRERNAGLKKLEPKESGVKNDSGRGFSESDPYKKVLNQNHHPTVKPIKLMEYLITLVTPVNGIVLDPFMGSGSTGVAAKNLSFKFIGIEMNEEYVEIAEKRIEYK